MKASEALSVDLNNHPIGLKGGKDASKIVSPNENQMKASVDQKASAALSKDAHQGLTNHGHPDKDLFEASK